MRNIPTPKRVIEINQKRRIRFLRLFFLFFLLFLSIVGALGYFSFNNKVTINNIKVTGVSIISTNDVISRVNLKLSGKYLHLYSRANYFIYPEKDIFNDLIESFPRIEKLSIIKERFNTIHINIEERFGSYLYCGSSIPEEKLEVGENCYFINNDGYVFDKAPYFSGNVYFRYYKKIEDNDNPLNKNIFPIEHFHELVRFIDSVRKLEFEPISLVVGDDGINKLYLNHKLNETNPKITFKNMDDLEIILSNLSTAMTKSEFVDEINLKYSTLLYIDLRFKNKVLYKFE